MKTYWRLSLVVLFLFSAIHDHEGFSSSGRKEAGTDAQLPGVTIIDRATVSWDKGGGVTRVVLGVDQDDIVCVYRWFEEPGKPPTKAEVERYLGQHIRQSGGLSLNGLLPKNEVPVLAYRITRSRSLRQHGNPWSRPVRRSADRAPKAAVDDRCC